MAIPFTRILPSFTLANEIRNYIRVGLCHFHASSPMHGASLSIQMASRMRTSGPHVCPSLNQYDVHDPDFLPNRCEREALDTRTSLNTTR